MPGMCTFNNSWLTNPNYEKWVEKNASDIRTAKCKACSKIIDIANMGEAALKSHSTSKKHVQNCKIMKSAQQHNLRFYFNSASPSPNVMPKPAPTLTSYTSSNDVLKAEIFWTLRTVNTHSSFHSNEDIAQVFSLMFPDSAIANAKKAKKDNSLSLLTASNSPRKTAKVKQETLKDLEKEIEQKKFASH